MSDTDTAAPTAHDQMMDAYIGGDTAKAQTLMDRVNVETGIAEPVHSDPTALTPMPPAPTTVTTTCWRSSALIVASSRARPYNDNGCVGRFVRTRAVSDAAA